MHANTIHENKHKYIKHTGMNFSQIMLDHASVCIYSTTSSVI